MDGHMTARMGEDPIIPDVFFWGDLSSGDLLINDTISGERLLSCRQMSIQEMKYGPSGGAVARVKLPWSRWKRVLRILLISH